MSLELLDFSTAGHALLLLDLLDGSLALERRFKQHLITVTLDLLGLLTQLLLGGIVRDQFEVALAVEHELLFGVPFLLGLLDGPLFAEHGLLLRHEFLLLSPLHLPRVLLPVEHGHRVPDLLLLFTSLGHLPLQFLLGVEGPQLRVHLLLHHFALNVAPLVNELLLTLDRRAVVVELGVLLAQGVVRRLEFHVLAAGDLVSALLLSLVL